MYPPFPLLPIFLDNGDCSLNEQSDQCNHDVPCPVIFGDHVHSPDTNKPMASEHQSH